MCGLVRASQTPQSPSPSCPLYSSLFLSSNWKDNKDSSIRRREVTNFFFCLISVACCDSFFLVIALKQICWKPRAVLLFVLTLSWKKKKNGVSWYSVSARGKLKSPKATRTLLRSCRGFRGEWDWKCAGEKKRKRKRRERNGYLLWLCCFALLDSTQLPYDGDNKTKKKFLLGSVRSRHMSLLWAHAPLWNHWINPKIFGFQSIARWVAADSSHSTLGSAACCCNLEKK